jgi:hypothetical protein
MATRQDPKVYLFFTRTDNGKAAAKHLFNGLMNVLKIVTKKSPFLRIVLS